MFSKLAILQVLLCQMYILLSYNISMDRQNPSFDSFEQGPSELLFRKSQITSEQQAQQKECSRKAHIPFFTNNQSSHSFEKLSRPDHILPNNSQCQKISQDQEKKSDNFNMKNHARENELEELFQQLGVLNEKIEGNSGYTLGYLKDYVSLYVQNHSRSEEFFNTLCEHNILAKLFSCPIAQSRPLFILELLNLLLANTQEPQELVYMFSHPLFHSYLLVDLNPLKLKTIPPSIYSPHISLEQSERGTVLQSEAIEYYVQLLKTIILKLQGEGNSFLLKLFCNNKYPEFPLLLNCVLLSLKKTVPSEQLVRVTAQHCILELLHLMLKKNLGKPYFLDLHLILLFYQLISETVREEAQGMTRKSLEKEFGSHTFKYLLDLLRVLVTIPDPSHKTKCLLLFFEIFANLILVRISNDMVLSLHMVNKLSKGCQEIEQLKDLPTHFISPIFQMLGKFLFNKYLDNTHFATKVSLQQAAGDLQSGKFDQVFSQLPLMRILKVYFSNNVRLHQLLQNNEKNEKSSTERYNEEKHAHGEKGWDRQRGLFLFYNQGQNQQFLSLKQQHYKSNKQQTFYGNPTGWLFNNIIKKIPIFESLPVEYLRKICLFAGAKFDSSRSLLLFDQIFLPSSAYFFEWLRGHEQPIRWNKKNQGEEIKSKQSFNNGLLQLKNLREKQEGVSQDQIPKLVYNQQAILGTEKIVRVRPGQLQEQNFCIKFFFGQDSQDTEKCEINFNQGRQQFMKSLYQKEVIEQLLNLSETVMAQIDSLSKNKRQTLKNLEQNYRPETFYCPGQIYFILHFRKYFAANLYEILSGAYTYRQKPEEKADSLPTFFSIKVIKKLYQILYTLDICFQASNLDKSKLDSLINKLRNQLVSHYKEDGGLTKSMRYYIQTNHEKKMIQPYNKPGKETTLSQGVQGKYQAKMQKEKREENFKKKEQKRRSIFGSPTLKKKTSSSESRDKKANFRNSILRQKGKHEVVVKKMLYLELLRFAFFSSHLKDSINLLNRNVSNYESEQYLKDFRPEPFHYIFERKFRGITKRHVNQGKAERYEKYKRAIKEATVLYIKSGLKFIWREGRTENKDQQKVNCMSHCTLLVLADKEKFHISGVITDEGGTVIKRLKSFLDIQINVQAYSSQKIEMNQNILFSDSFRGQLKNSESENQEESDITLTLRNQSGNPSFQPSSCSQYVLELPELGNKQEGERVSSGKLMELRENLRKIQYEFDQEIFQLCLEQYLEMS